MKLKLITPIDSLSKAYFKQTVTDGELENFTRNVKVMLESFNDKESEEYNKNLVRDFLLNTYYKDKYAINTKERDDLVIHHDKMADSKVAVIIEAKKRSNKGEMVSAAKPNAKALHELIYYYLIERYKNEENNIKNLIATNGYEWFVFDEVWFEKNIYRNAGLKKAYLEFKPSGNDTRHFYDNIAKVFLSDYEDDIPCTYINLLETFGKAKPGKKEVKALYKFFAPEHLLKKPFANDSNLLNKDFYYELLYILGLEEKKDGSKKLIERAGKTRNDASLLENTISRLQRSAKWKNVNNLNGYGETEEQQIFSVALELCINWLNRVLFLKLLEGQLIRYQVTAKGAKVDAAFLNIDIIKDYDELNELFFEVLAKPLADRDNIKNEFRKIPYLNSSLFEPSELEQATIEIASLKDRLEMPLLGSTVLKDDTKTKTGKLHTLEYLFKFLDAYDFSSDENDESQRDSKPIINAAVLGLIFEKINGYKDGSFFTPSFITMYMSRESLRRAVVQKFNDTYKGQEWHCNNLTEVYNEITRHKISIKEANEVVNSLKICDPAVGSGHFLVSSLNELIAIKYELQILADKNFKLIGGYNLTIERDELILMHGLEFFSYNYTDTESQRVQETLFKEKQTLIENCLFGVDINPKSVMICRLRLWIELLKSAYYTKGATNELQTLPNIDINIKCGNSLISRYSLTEDLSEVFRKQKYSRKTYLLLVESYKNATGKEEKEELRKLIKDIKDNFRATVLNNNPVQKSLNLKKGELIALDHVDLWGKRKLNEDQVELAKRRLNKEITALQQQLEDYRSGAIYRDAFEWRFEFPEVLNEEGKYIGFDVVIGNPPYVAKSFSDQIKEYLNANYKTSQYQLDMYVAFMERGISLLRPAYIITYITPNSWLKNIMFTECRKYLLDNISFISIVPNLKAVFEEASVDTLIFIASKQTMINAEGSIEIMDVIDNKISGIHQVNQELFRKNERYVFDVQVDSEIRKITEKIRAKSDNHELYCDITRGVNPYDKYSGQSSEDIKNKIYHSTIKKDETFIPEIRGKHLSYYSYSWDGQSYISYGDWLAAPREKKFFEGERLVMRQVLSGRLVCTIITENIIIDQSIFISKIKEEFKDKINIRYILALFASNLYVFYFRLTSNEFDALFPKIKIGEFRSLPVKGISTDKQLPFITLVDKILSVKKDRPLADTSTWEWQLEALGFNIYGLDDSEALLVLNSSNDLSSVAKNTIMNHLQDIRSGRFKVKL